MKAFKAWGYGTLALLIGALIFGDAAHAQLQSTVVAGSDNGTTRRILKTDNTGRLEVVGSAAGGVVYGPDTQGAAPSQAPITIGCLYLSSPATVTNNQISRTLCDANGRLQVGVSGTVAATQSGTWNVGVTGTVAATQSGTWTVQPGNTANTTPWLVIGNGTAADNTTLTNSLKVTSIGGVYDGSTIDLARSVEGATGGAGLGVTAVSMVPNSSANVGITPIVSSAAEGSRVFKGSAGNLYSVNVTAGATSGYLMMFNATSAPADGAVTPLLCRAVAANSSVEVDHSIVPDIYSTGITAVFSSTGCFTKTVSATAMFEGRIK